MLIINKSCTYTTYNRFIIRVLKERIYEIISNHSELFNMIGMFFYTAFIAVAFLYQESVKNLKNCYSLHFSASNHNKQGTKTFYIMHCFLYNLQENGR